MESVSRRVSSNQEGPHPRLAEVVRRHLASDHRKPPAAHNRAAGERLMKIQQRTGLPLVLDSFCGTGRSTAELAVRHPEHLVVGIDKSAHRLSRHQAADATNYLLLQADCEPVWQMLAEAGMQVQYHYLLYPNPWPKAAHLQRRVHGHPGFRQLVALGGEIELRSNWRLYVEEFAQALEIAGIPARVEQLPAGPEPLTQFEEKYAASGQALWRALAAGRV